MRIEQECGAVGLPRERTVEPAASPPGAGWLICWGVTTVSPTATHVPAEAGAR
jgi:hypothetical protein